MGEMEKIVHQNLDMSRQTDFAGEQMLQQAAALKHISSQLMRIIRGEKVVLATGVISNRQPEPDQASQLKLLEKGS